MKSVTCSACRHKVGGDFCIEAECRCPCVQYPVFVGGYAPEGDYAKALLHISNLNAEVAEMKLELNILKGIAAGLRASADLIVDGFWEGEDVLETYAEVIEKIVARWMGANES